MQSACPLKIPRAACPLPPPEETGPKRPGGCSQVLLPRTSMRMLLSMPSATNLSSAPCRLAGTERMVSVCRVPSQRTTYTLLACRACPSRNHLPAEVEVRSTEKVTSPPSTASTAFRGVFTASWGTVREGSGRSWALPSLPPESGPKCPLCQETHGTDPWAPSPLTQVDRPWELEVGALAEAVHS